MTQRAVEESAECIYAGCRAKYAEWVRRERRDEYCSPRCRSMDRIRHNGARRAADGPRTGDQG